MFCFLVYVSYLVFWPKWPWVLLTGESSGLGGHLQGNFVARETSGILGVNVAFEFPSTCVASRFLGTCLASEVPCMAWTSVKENFFAVFEGV